MRHVGSVAGGQSFSLSKCVVSSVVVTPVVVLLLCLNGVRCVVFFVLLEL